MDKMDKKKLAALAANPTAMGVLTALAQRQREPREGRLELRRASQDARKMGVPVIAPDFLALFEGLEALGVGKVIKIKGKEPSFQWAQGVNMHDICRAALEEAAGAATTPATASDANTKTIHAMLAPGRYVTFAVPSDLTPEEAKFLSQILMSTISC